MAKFGFANPPEFLSDTKITSMSAAELRAEAGQRGWPAITHMGDRATRVKFWQLQQQLMTVPTTEPVVVHELTESGDKTDANTLVEDPDSVGKGADEGEKDQSTQTETPQAADAESSEPSKPAEEIIVDETGG